MRDTRNRQMPNKVRNWPTLTIRVPPKVYEEVKAIADATDRSLSFVGQELVEEALEQRRKK